MFKIKKINKKAEIRWKFPHSRAKIHCQTTLVSIFLASVNINLIMKLVRKL